MDLWRFFTIEQISEGFVAQVFKLSRHNIETLDRLQTCPTADGDQALPIVKGCNLFEAVNTGYFEEEIF